MANEPGGGEFRVTPEEDRFLRAFFRRHAGRYLAVLGAAAIAAVCATLLLSPATVDVEPAVDAQEIAALRGESETLRSELAALRERLEADASGESKRLATLEKRVAGVLRRLEQVESGPVQREGAQAPDGAAAWDVSSILERLYALEMRQRNAESDREEADRAILERLHGLESRSLSLGSPPAAPTP